jgi:hypothetical protein
MVYDSWAAQKAATRVDSIMDAVATLWQNLCHSV